MKTILAILIAAALTLCATVWPPAATADNTPTSEPPPAVAAETAPVEPQAEDPTPQPDPTEPKPQEEPAQPDTTAEPEPTPAPQEKIITEEEELQPTTETVEPTIVDPEPPAQTADIGTVIAAAEAFAIETYGVTIDPSLDFDNSACRFPAVVPLTVDQDTFNYKAIDIVDYTFQQMMRRNDATIEKMLEAAIRCKVHVVKNEQDYQIYCMYA